MGRSGRWKRKILTAATAAGSGLAAVATHTMAAPLPGTTTAVVAQPAGWHGISNGSIIDYWTTASDGALRHVSGALFVPSGKPPPEGWPIIAYDHGTTGLGVNCGGITNPVYGSDREDEFLRYFLAHGFAVVAPDYVGLGRFATGPHPYLEIRSEAAATIDLVRAARTANPRLSRTWATFGASQGGQAALGTAWVQQTVAPDLDFRGAVADDPESDVEKLIVAIGGPHVPDIPLLTGPTTGFVAMILAGLRAARPDLNVNDYLTPLGRELLDGIGGLCLLDIADRTKDIKIGTLLSRPLGDDDFRSAIEEYMEVPTSGYDAPVLLLLNATDTIVPSPLHAALAAQMVLGGVRPQIVVGANRHTHLDDRMWAALDEFLDRIVATPPRP
ncbi:lipase family protein [Nocardia sp. alder85J]|uniref:lipase family protein n=1 Tax=Nocardia sp. alder85J TaxID=2862949 RepID=UPI001CD38571|nr:lipase family protein [Nocardia sp. alder85J]MCX4097162.1 lipase family protein [Nocardia sp. alder85J]